MWRAAWVLGLLPLAGALQHGGNAVHIDAAEDDDWVTAINEAHVTGTSQWWITTQIDYMNKNFPPRSPPPWGNMACEYLGYQEIKYGGAITQGEFDHRFSHPRACVQFYQDDVLWVRYYHIQSGQFYRVYDADVTRRIELYAGNSHWEIIRMSNTGEMQLFLYNGTYTWAGNTVVVVRPEYYRTMYFKGGYTLAHMVGTPYWDGNESNFLITHLDSFSTIKTDGLVITMDSHRSSFVVNRSTSAPPAVRSVADPSVLGDPHVWNVKGDKFDMVRPGPVEMLRLPKHALTNEANFTLEAVLTPIKRCGQTVITEFSISGSSVDALHVMATKDGAVIRAADGQTAKSVLRNMEYSVDSTLHQKSQLLIKPYNIVLKFWVTMQGGLPAFDLHTRGVANLGSDVGGMLGYDDHTDVTKMPAECAHQ